MKPIRSITLIVGMEVHVELATRSKMFSRAPNPAHPDFDAAGPNSLIDPTVQGLPGALPVMNRAAVEMSMMVGLALGCSIAPLTKWDRKSYFYPDLPKGYQLSQYDLPLCFDGSIDVPPLDEKGFPIPGAEARRIGIIRAHLEEDAGKLLHEAPGGGRLDFSIVDLNRAGTPLLEIVTQPDFDSADRAVSFARLLRNICRFLGVTGGVMQKGQMRFEPNINTNIIFEDGLRVTTPIVEIKNLNSFKALRAAIEFELADQPRRWKQDGREHGPGMKRTRGWDDNRQVTVLQREKEDAHDYRYFPDPDLPPVAVDQDWISRVRLSLPELPLARLTRYMHDFALAPAEAAALTEERETCLLYERVIGSLVTLGVERSRAGRAAANWLLQAGARRANERGVPIHDLGITANEIAAIARLREDGKLGNAAADELFGERCAAAAPRGEPPSDGAEPMESPAAAMARLELLAGSRGLLVVRDDAALDGWCDQVIAANEKAAADVRGGKAAAVGRLVGEVMKLSGGQADARAVRERLLAKLST